MYDTHKVKEEENLSELKYTETKWEKFCNKIDDIALNILPDCYWSTRRKLLDTKDEVRWASQRAIRGYDNRMVWGACDVIPELLVKVFTNLRDNHMGYPGTEEINTDEEWIRILNKIIFLLNEMNEEKCSVKNEYQDEFDYYLMNKQETEDGVWKNNMPEELSKKYYDRENEIYEYRIKCKDEAFDLMKKYWFELWD